MSIPHEKYFRHSLYMGFSGGTVVKNLSVNIGDAGDQSLVMGWEDPLEEVATYSSILA